MSEIEHKGKQEKDIKQTNKSNKIKISTQQKNNELELFLKSFGSRNNDDENKWTCNKCGLKFIRSTSALHHLERVHSIQYETLCRYNCEHCDLVFTNKDSLKQHFYRVHKQNDVDIYENAPQYTYDENRNYICNVCEVKFKKRATLLSHLSDRHGIVIEYLYVCGICQRNITSRAGLIAHVKSKHGDIKHDRSDTVNVQKNVSLDARDWQTAPVKVTVVCFPKGVTAKNYSTNSDVILKIEENEKTDVYHNTDVTHFDGDDEACDNVLPTENDQDYDKNDEINEMKNKSLFKKRTELNLKEEPELNFDTNVEKKSFKSKRSYESFLNQEQQEEMRQCAACGNILSSGDKLLLHIKNVHSVEYARIKEEFSNFGSTSSDSEEDNDDLLDCDICNKKFSNLKQYSLHVKSSNHRQNLSPSCSILSDGDSFVDEDCFNLNSEKIIICDICALTFETSDELESHKNIFHSNSTLTIENVKQEKLVLGNEVSGKVLATNSGCDKPVSIDVIKRRCHLCKIIFDTKELLSLHKEVKHCTERKVLNEAKNIECLVCRKNFVSNRSLREHQRTVHSWHDSILLTCKICGATLTSQLTLKSHVTKHENKEILYDLFFIDSNGKHYTFEEMELRLQKNKGITNNKESSVIVMRFKCKLCGKILKARQSITFHLNALHGENNQQLFHCVYCDYKCKVNKYLQIHIATKHPDSEIAGGNAQRYICDECGYDTINKRAFTSHRHRHKAFFKCSLCEYSTKHQTLFILHRRKHEERKPFKCDFANCEYASAIRGQLKLHRMQHEPEKYTKCCDVCGFKTLNPYIMNRHRKEHYSGLKYHCEQCPYVTISKINFRTHSSVHREPKTCSLCNFKTKYNQTMRCHMKSKHSIVVLKRLYPKNKNI